MKGKRILPAALLMLLGTGCPPRLVQGPDIGNQQPITEIKVEPIGPGTDQPVQITDPAAVKAALELFSPVGWWHNDDRLVPTHCVHLRSSDGNSYTYWIGAFSDPPRPPCFWFCSGFWAAASTADGELKPDMIKPLATSGEMFAVNDLLRPATRGSQSNNRIKLSVRAVTAVASATAAPARPAAYAVRYTDSGVRQ